MLCTAIDCSHQNWINTTEGKVDELCRMLKLALALSKAFFFLKYINLVHFFNNDLHSTYSILSQCNLVNSLAYYSKTCPRRNVNKAETCSMWTISIVPARIIGITVLFIFYNVESAQRGNGKQYLKNLLKIACIKRKVF
jgi:hypothetical protein